LHEISASMAVQDYQALSEYSIGETNW
jgi:hypothetical protein